MKLTPAEQRDIYELAEKNNKTFFVYWNYSAEDIIFNVKNIYPKLNAEFIETKTDKGKKTDIFSIDGEIYQTNTETDNHVYDVVTAINKHLEKDNVCFITFDSLGEDIIFILIDLPDLPEYLEKGFIEI